MSDDTDKGLRDERHVVMFMDMSNIKPSLLNALMIAGIVIVTIPLIKFAVNKYPVPGLTPLVNAV